MSDSDFSHDTVRWTHDALEHLYDPAFLRKHLRVGVSRGQFTDERAAQNALLDVIKQLRPPDDISIHSPPWRTWNILNLRYVQGLTQREAAAQLNVSERHLRNEQRAAIRAVATLLFDNIGPSSDKRRDADANTASPQHDVDLTGRDVELVRLDETLRAVLGLLDPLLHRQNLQMRVTLPDIPPITSSGSMLTRQLLISVISWLIRDVTDATLNVAITTADGLVWLTTSKPNIATRQRDQGDQALDAIRQIVEAMKARLTVSLAGGSQRIEIGLPAADVWPVLVIDDDTRAIELVRRYLQAHRQFVVVEATRAEDALHKAAALQPACILLDVMMPGHDGWELLTLLKAAPKTSAIPVIISSVLKEQELPIALGAAAVLRKPFNAHQLLEALEHIVSATAPQLQATLPATARPAIG